MDQMGSSYTRIGPGERIVLEDISPGNKLYLNELLIML